MPLTDEERQELKRIESRRADLRRKDGDVPSLKEIRAMSDEEAEAWHRRLMADRRTEDRPFDPRGNLRRGYAAAEDGDLVRRRRRNKLEDGER